MQGGQEKMQLSSEYYQKKISEISNNGLLEQNQRQQPMSVANSHI